MSADYILRALDSVLNHPSENHGLVSSGRGVPPTSKAKLN